HVDADAVAGHDVAGDFVAGLAGPQQHDAGQVVAVNEVVLDLRTGRPEREDAVLVGEHRVALDLDAGGGVEEEDAGGLEAVHGGVGVAVAGHLVVPDPGGGAVADLDAVLGDDAGRPGAGDGVAEDLGGRAGVLDQDAALLVAVDAVVD